MKVGGGHGGLLWFRPQNIYNFQGLNIFHDYLQTDTCAEYARPNDPHASDHVQEGHGIIALFG